MTVGQETAAGVVIWVAFWSFLGAGFLVAIGRLPADTFRELGWFGAALLCSCVILLGNLIWSGVMRLYRRHLQPQVLAR